MSLPYEPGRAAFASLERTADDLARLAAAASRSCRPRDRVRAARRSRTSSARSSRTRRLRPPPLDGAIRFLEGAGGARDARARRRGDARACCARGTAPERDRRRLPVARPVARAARDRLRRRSASRIAVEAQAPALRRRRSGRRSRRCSASPGSAAAAATSSASSARRTRGCTRAHADYLEGRLRGRGDQLAGARRGGDRQAPRRSRSRSLDRAARRQEPLAAARELAARDAARAPRARTRRRTTRRAQLDLRAYEARLALLDELEGWERARRARSPARRSSPRSSAPPSAARARPTSPAASPSSTSCAPARAGSSRLRARPGGGEPSAARASSPFLDDEARRRHARAQRGARLARPDQVSRERYLFYTACTRASAPRCTSSARPRPTTARRARRARSGTRCARSGRRTRCERWTTRRPLSALTWPLEARADRARAAARARRACRRERRRKPPTLRPRERLGAAARARARVAFDRPTRLRHPAVLEQLRAAHDLRRHRARGVRGLLLDVVHRAGRRPARDRRRGRRAPARLGRALGALQVLRRAAEGARRRSGSSRRSSTTRSRSCASASTRRSRGRAARADRRSSAASSSRASGATSRRFVRDEAESELDARPAPLRGLVRLGARRAGAAARARPRASFALSGKIDRIDVDPFSARGIVQDYKSGKTAHSAAQIEKELRLQIPLYMLVLRDLVGIEPLGGLYRRARRRAGRARAAARAAARDGVPGLRTNDYLDEDDFWGQVDGARRRRATLAGADPEPAT